MYILLAWIIHGFSFLIPKNKKLWVVMGWRKNKQGELFGDNAKYFYLHVSQNVKDVKIIWIGQDNRICEALNKRSYLAYNIHSLKGIWSSLRAGYTIIDANLRLKNWQYCGGSRIVQLWHGKSLKKTGYESPYAMGRYNRFTSPHLYNKYFLFTTASKFLGDFHVLGFRLNPDDVVITGLPRYDIFFKAIKDSDIDLDSELENKLRRLKNSGYKKIVFYAPTFRPDGSDPLKGADLYLLNNTLTKKNYYCIISLHPKFTLKDWHPRELFSNIYFANVGADIYPLMRNFDLLITDYSSLALDFLLINVPHILYIYDLESFKKGMGIHQEIAEVMPGPKVEKFTDLLELIESNGCEWNKNYDKAKDLFFAYQDGNSSRRIADILNDSQ